MGGERTNIKIKICGKKIKTTYFSKGIRIKKDKSKEEKKEIKNTKKKTNDTEVSEENKYRQKLNRLKCARNAISDTIDCNVYKYSDYNGNKCIPVLMSVSYKENITDLGKIKNDYKELIKKINNYISKKIYIDKPFIGLQYVYIIEEQDRGSLHIHSMVFNMPDIDIKDISKKWKGGSLDLKKIFPKKGEDSIEHVKAYMLKGLKKENLEQLNKTFNSNQYYTTSKKVYKPEIIYETEENKQLVNEILEGLKDSKLVYHNIYLNEYTGKCTYTIHKK